MCIHISVENPEKNGQFLALYFLLSYIISWTFWVALIIAFQLNIGSIRDIVDPTNDFFINIITRIGLFGPALASVIVIYYEKKRSGLRELFSRIKKWRVGIEWYIAIIFVSIIPVLCALTVDILVDGSLPEIFSITFLFSAVILFFFILFFGGGLEEPGWRGYALPALQSKYNVTKSSLILGFCWCFWHFPLFFIPGSSRGGLSSFPGFLLIGLGITFIFTWLYNNTESLFATILFHTMFNISSELLLPSSDNSIVGIVYMVVLWALVLLIGLKSYWSNHNTKNKIQLF